MSYCFEGLILTFDVKKYGMEWYGHTGWINMVKYSNSGVEEQLFVDHKQNFGSQDGKFVLSSRNKLSTN